MTVTRTALEKARVQVRSAGLLLETDKERPSLVGLLVGEPVAGSWWGHPKGAEIYAVLTALADDPDVVFAKLIDGKITLVDRRLWPSLVAVATAGERWQQVGLSPDALRLLEQVRAEGPLSTDQLARDTPGRRKLAAAARELESRLLVRSEQVHTEHGAHARVLDTWERWADQQGLSRGLPPAEQARAELERVAAAQGAEVGSLPWGEAYSEPEVRMRAKPATAKAKAKPSAKATAKASTKAKAKASAKPARAKVSAQSSAGRPASVRSNAKGLRTRRATAGPGRPASRS